LHHVNEIFELNVKLRYKKVKGLIFPVISLTIWTRLKGPCTPVLRRIRWRNRKNYEKEKERENK
jgi:hypothetical protein